MPPGSRWVFRRSTWQWHPLMAAGSQVAKNTIDGLALSRPRRGFAHPTACGNERGCPRADGALERSSRCRAPDGFAPRGSARRLRRRQSLPAGSSARRTLRQKFDGPISESAALVHRESCSYTVSIGSSPCHFAAPRGHDLKGGRYVTPRFHITFRYSENTNEGRSLAPRSIPRIINPFRRSHIFAVGAA